MNKYNFGIVGLEVMGWDLLLNRADNGFAVTRLDLDSERAESLQSEARDEKAMKVTTMLLMPAGKPVDANIIKGGIDEGMPVWGLMNAPDYFNAHRCVRVDQEGVLYTQWN